MAAKENSVKRYVVRLSADEREQLEALIRKEKGPAQRLLKALYAEQRRFVDPAIAPAGAVEALAVFRDQALQPHQAGMAE